MGKLSEGIIGMPSSYLPIRSIYPSFELYGSIVHDLRIGWPCLCSLFKIHPPGNEKRLIQIYAVATHTIGKLIAVWIAFTIPGDLIDVEVFRIGIVWKVFLGSSIEIHICDHSNAVKRICSVYGEVRVRRLPCSYMVNPIDDYEFIGIVAQSNCRLS